MTRMFAYQLISEAISRIKRRIGFKQIVNLILTVAATALVRLHKFLFFDITVF